MGNSQQWYGGKEDKRTQLEPGRSSNNERNLEENEGTESEQDDKNATSEETRKQIRPKYDKMEIGDPEGWNWPSGPHNKRVPKFKEKCT